MLQVYGWTGDINQRRRCIVERQRSGAHRGDGDFTAGKRICTVLCQLVYIQRQGRHDRHTLDYRKRIFGNADLIGQQQVSNFFYPEKLIFEIMRFKPLK